MGTWSLPNTTEKAKALKTMMAEPILRHTAADQLYDLTGDDNLFDFIGASPDDTKGDMRIYVHRFLQRMLDNMDRMLVPWDEEAVNICQEIVGQDELSYTALK